MTDEIPEKVEEELRENEIVIMIETFRPEAERFYSYQMHAYIHPNLRNSSKETIQKSFCRYVDEEEDLANVLEEEVQKFQKHMEEETSFSGTPYWRAKYKLGSSAFPTFTKMLSEEVKQYEEAE